MIDTAYYADLDQTQADLRWFYFLTEYVGLDDLKSGEKPGLPRELFCRQLFPFPPLREQKAFPNLNAPQIKGFQLVIPPGGVLERFAAADNRFRDRIRSNLRQSHLLAGTRDVLLPRLMSGALRVWQAEQMIEAAE